MEKREKILLAASFAAAILAVILLAASGLGGFRALAGAKTVTEGAELTAGQYVEADLAYIMDVIGVERKADGSAAAYYAVAPIGNQFVVIRFPASDYENMTLLEEASAAYLRGDTRSMDFHLVVTGEVRALDDATAALLVDWFNSNAEWMSRAGAIAAVEDYGVYLSRLMVASGRVGGFSYGASVTMTVVSVLALAAAAGGFVYLGTGRAGGKKRKRHG